MHVVVGLALQFGDDRLGESGGDRETDADRAARRRIDRRIDADDLAVHVEHRPAGIAPVDRGVGLQEIVVGAGLDVALAGREDARGDAAAETERIADRQHPIADPRGVAVAPGGGGQRLVGLDLQQRDIGLGVAPDELGLQIGVVVQNDGDLVGVGDHVIVGYDITRRVDDKAGAERGALARLSLRTAPLGHAMLEEVPKELLERRARRELRHFGSAVLTPAFGFHRLRRRNVDHRGQ